jgi:hypothetical protein
MLAGQETYAKRQFNEDVSVQYSLAAATAGPVALIAAKTGFTLHIQRIIVYIVTSVAQNLTFQGSVSGLEVGHVPNSPTDGSQIDIDWGGDGVELSADEGLNLVISSAGPAALIKVYAYRTKNSD